MICSRTESQLSPAYCLWSDKGLSVKVHTTLGMAEIVDARPLYKKTMHIALAILFCILTLIGRCYRVFFATNKEYTYSFLSTKNTYYFPAQCLPWNKMKSSEGLFLFIHGLFGTPIVWEEYVKEVRIRYPLAHIFTPRVPFRGNCNLELAAKPFQKAIKYYLQTFPGRPVTLIGTSNGARIASYIETELDPKLLGNSRLSIISLAGVHYGTKLVNLISTLKLLGIFRLNPRLAADFHFGSTYSQTNLAKWHDKQLVWDMERKNVRHFYCASTEDEQVITSSSALPYHPRSVITYNLISGHSHISMVDGARAHVFNWIEK